MSEDRQNLHLSRRQQAEIGARQCAQLLKDSFGANEVYLFGSFAGHSPWHSRSDIDLAVKGLSSDRYMSALAACHELLPDDIQLDLVTLENAPPALMARIKLEVAMVHDALEDTTAALKQQIGLETTNLERLVDEAKKLIRELSATPSSIQLRASGSIIHDFYTACERIFERIAVHRGTGVPAGERQVTLLRSMEIDSVGAQIGLLDHSLANRLHDYMRFRHLFRHSYGYELDWEKLQPLLTRLEETKISLEDQLYRFFHTLAGN